VFSGARRDAGEESEEIRFKVVAVAVFVAMGESKRTRETMLDIYSSFFLSFFLSLSL
tara:strand:- start:107 stop:277 length:171 start_codon:yes stop_codon:yes gene_type:complete